MMTNEQKIKLHRHILDDLHELYKTKNFDYGDSVHHTYKKYGMTSYLVRVEDKLNRVNALLANKYQKVNDEKLQDSLLDAANYLILAFIDLENDKSEMVSEASYEPPYQEQNVLYCKNCGKEAHSGTCSMFSKEGDYNEQ